ncbi:hypothetical protein Pmani_039407 [Petrolisthes manimaculis]|uniref:Uncharacterized protein n=1 Tax=Petrolisthes manimaculis TaxID=1843537 RepID=A0AAE1NCN4_9EUCA|nr:hypothetical protein Pmani_039407 [Petrolisthes manimaculis]
MVCVMVCDAETLTTPVSAPQTLPSGPITTTTTTNTNDATQSSSLLLSSLRHNDEHPVPSSYSSNTHQERGNVGFSDSIVANQANYIKKRASDLKICKNITTSKNLQGVAKTESTSGNFFIRPLPSFTKLLLKMRLGNRLIPSEIFLVEKEIEVTLSDLQGSMEGGQESTTTTSEKTTQFQPTSEGDGEWYEISALYYERSVRGLNKHSLNVTFKNSKGEETLTTLNTDYRWLLYDYLGFSVYSKGAANFLFYCSPELPEVVPRAGRATNANVSSEGGRPTGVWLLAGLLCVATLLLAVLLTAWIVLRHKTKRRKKRERENNLDASVGSQVYEEFDEEVLRNIRKKVESLRYGRGDCEQDDVCVVTYSTPCKPATQTMSNDNYKQHQQHQHHGLSIMNSHPSDPTNTNTDTDTPRYVDPRTLLCRSPQPTGIADDDKVGNEGEPLYEDLETLLGKRAATKDPNPLLKKKEERLMREDGVTAAPSHYTQGPHTQANSQPRTEATDGVDEEGGLYEDDDEVFYDDPKEYHGIQLQKEEKKKEDEKKKKEDEKEGKGREEEHYQNIYSTRSNYSNVFRR